MNLQQPFLMPWVGLTTPTTATPATPPQQQPIVSATVATSTAQQPQQAAAKLISVQPQMTSAFPGAAALFANGQLITPLHAAQHYNAALQATLPASSQAYLYPVTAAGAGIPVQSNPPMMTAVGGGNAGNGCLVSPQQSANFLNNGGGNAAVINASSLPKMYVPNGSKVRKVIIND